MITTTSILLPAGLASSRICKALAPRAANEEIVLLWIACGKDDSAMPGERTMSEKVNRIGIEHAFMRTAVPAGGVEAHSLSQASLDKSPHIGICCGGSSSMVDSFKAQVKPVPLSYGSMRPGRRHNRTSRRSRTPALKVSNTNRHKPPANGSPGGAAFVNSHPYFSTNKRS
jgi:hypothetical protein